jgi:hypothetical protein
MRNFLMSIFLLSLILITISSCHRESRKFKIYNLDSDPTTTYEQKIQKLRGNISQNGSVPISCNVKVNLDSNRGRNEGLVAFDSINDISGSIINFNNRFDFSGLPKSVDVRQTPFLIKYNPTIDPLKTMNETGMEGMDGVLVSFGLAKTNGGKSNEFYVEIFLKLVKIDFIKFSRDSVCEVTKYALLNKEKVLFRCKDLKNGVWERISKEKVDASENELAKLKKYSGFKGYYVGRNNFINGNDIVKAKDKYIYLGYATTASKQNLQIIIANQILTTSTKAVLDSKGNPISTEIVWDELQNHRNCYCTMSDKIMNPIHQQATYSLSKDCQGPIYATNSSCIRPCPSYCPKD